MDSSFLSSPNINDLFWVLLIIASRFYGIMFVCPIFNETRLPRFLKIVLSLLLAIIVFPYFKKINISDNIFNHVFLLAKEFFYGVFISYIISLPIWLIESIGNIIDIQRGDQFGATINQLTHTQDAAMSSLLVNTFTTYFVLSNGLLFILGVAFKSFLIIPVDSLFPLYNLNVNIYIELFTSYMYWVLLLVLPVIAVLFFIDFIFGLIGAFIPKLNITIIAMPIKSIIAISILIFYLPIMYHQVFAKFMLNIRTLFN